MTTVKKPVGMSNNHYDTLSQIFQHPTSHNIEWRAVLSLLTELGAVEEKHDGKYTVTLGDESETLDRPREKDIDVQMVVDLRRMLSGAGYGPEPTDS
ncbi:hypothetical protein [Subtercola sp. YIM 133946]|uniref:hypothetical protein n=1 Tax=Subtercola sp. YIM 133946 TaxID=3118909 RepID=UPI002F93CFC2